MSGPLRNQLRRGAVTALVAVLFWQAGAGAWHVLDAVWQRRMVGYGLRLTADTSQRMRAQLGEDIHIHDRIVEIVPPGAPILTLLPAAEDATMADQQRGETVNRLRHLINTDRFMSLGMPDSVALAEATTSSGQDSWLLVLGGVGAPVGRSGWTLEADEPRFQLWRFRKA